jgi:hypothetical protein
LLAKKARPFARLSDKEDITLTAAIFWNAVADIPNGISIRMSWKLSKIEVVISRMAKIIIFPKVRYGI